MNGLSRRAALGLMGGAAALPVLGTPVLANTKLNVGALRFTSHAASFVAFERGYFAEEGLDVEFRFFEAAQPMAVAIASGDADYAVTAISGGLISLAEKRRGQGDRRCPQRGKGHRRPDDPCVERGASGRLDQPGRS